MGAKFDPDNSEISKAGLLIRREFCANMQQCNGNLSYGKYVIPRWDGGRDEDGRLFKSNVWDKLVPVFSSSELDTEMYVEFAFSKFGISSPYDLKREEIIKAYRDVMLGPDTPLLFSTGYRILDKNLTIRSSYESSKDIAFKRTVNDGACGVSPLVRCSYAYCNNKSELVADTVRAAAFAQYMGKRFFYNHFFKDKIPMEFINRSDECNEHA